MSEEEAMATALQQSRDSFKREQSVNSNAVTHLQNGHAHASPGNTLPK